MAPYPEEIDVFSTPHSRMKALVDVYSEKLTCTDFTDFSALQSLLKDLHHTFCEFKSHEQIENKYIMRKLKKRLKLLSIHDAAVCNCHNDNKLSDMLALVEDGYTCDSKPEAERLHFGQKLQNALQEFTGSFLPHMKEEEEVFQPMLMKYFGYEELKCLKERVILEHIKWQAYEKSTLEEAQADLKVDQSEASPGSCFSRLPPEILSHILSFLSPRDLLRCSEVSHLWYEMAKEPTLWKELYPCDWAHGVWGNYEESHEDRVRQFYPNEALECCRDEDADIPEYDDDSSSGVDDMANSSVSEAHWREIAVLQSMVKHLLPTVGSGVQKIVLTSSRSLTSGLLRSMLVLCPSITHLDVSYTAVLDSAFKGLKELSCCSNLQYLNLSGCKNITDLGLFRLADCMALLPPQVPEGSGLLRNVYLEDCCRLRQECDDSDLQQSECFCEIEDSGLQLNCGCEAANFFCNSVCLWQKDGVMCHLAKLSLQCPFVEPHFVSPGASSVVKTTATTLPDVKAEREERRSLRYLNLSGCKEVTDEGLRCLLDAGILQQLEFLDVSGCWLMTGSELSFVTDSLAHLMPENIFYCDQISDGPYPETANGCQNLENGTRACCRQTFH